MHLCASGPWLLPETEPTEKRTIMRLIPLSLDSLRDVYLQELRDLYSAERQLVSALPKVADAASSSDLRNALSEHYEITKEHVNRLERIFDKLGESPTGETYHAMKGLVEEGEAYVHANGADRARDAGLIIAGQKVEHYEIAGYGSARTLAQVLGESETADLLQKTLDEEHEADRRLTSIAESHINMEASGSEGDSGI